MKKRFRDRFKSKKPKESEEQSNEESIKESEKEPRKSLLDSLMTGPFTSYKKRIDKENAALAKEGKGMRIVAFALTLISMALAMSFIPFLPQPLPILVAVLVAFAVYFSPALGMSVGSTFIVLGILYQLSLIDFIGMLGPAIVRVLFICILIFLFVALAIRFRSYEDAIGINLGIIAAMFLFSNSTFFMAIPLLLTMAIVLKKTQAGLSFAYYALISVPLMVMQYYLHIVKIARVDFWNDATAVPPLYTSLSSVYTSMHAQTGLLHFRLFDFSQTLGKITWNVVEPSPTPVHTVAQAVNQYLDSFPGMILLIVMVVGIVLAITFMLPSLISGSNISGGDTLFPILTAAGITALFFFFVSALKVPLSFSTNITTTQMILGILSSFAFAVPIVALNLTPKKRAEMAKKSELALLKVDDLMKKVTAFEETIGKVKVTAPVDVSSPEIRMNLIRDRLADILSKLEAKKLKLREINAVLKELAVNLTEGVDSLPPELNVILERYQLSMNYSYTAWMKKLKEIGYEVKNPVQIEFQKEQDPQSRAEYISAVLTASRVTANDVCQLAEQIYGVIQSVYDPSLPAVSGTVSYCKQKLANNTAPWLACDALVLAIKNWAKEYEPQISTTILNLQNGLGSIVRLGTQNVGLEGLLGEKYSSIAFETKKADELRASLGSGKISILNAAALKSSVMSSLDVSRNVVSILYEDLKTKEESIENLSPVKDGFWEKNVTVREQTAAAIKKISDAARYTPFDMLKNLPEALSFIDPCIWTIDLYTEKNELLLNYPVAKNAIEDQLKKKKRVTVQDLPFETKDAEEFMKLFYRERRDKISFDEENMLLEKKS